MKDTHRRCDRHAKGAFCSPEEEKKEDEGAIPLPTTTTTSRSDWKWAGGLQTNPKVKQQKQRRVMAAARGVQNLQGKEKLQHSLCRNLTYCQNTTLKKHHPVKTQKEKGPVKIISTTKWGLPQSFCQRREALSVPELTAAVSCFTAENKECIHSGRLESQVGSAAKLLRPSLPTNKMSTSQNCSPVYTYLHSVTMAASLNPVTSE